MKLKLLIFLLVGLVTAGFAGLLICNRVNINKEYTIGQAIDSLNHVVVYYNGGVGHVLGRNTAADGYNLGLKYQCVEYVKRYYYEYYNHKMPDSYGHAVDFFDKELDDGKENKKRNLVQYKNPGGSRPLAGDLIVFDGTVANRYGHVAIVSDVNGDELEIIQQNPGPHASSRVTFSLEQCDGSWEIKNKRILGWLRKK